MPENLLLVWAAELAPRAAEMRCAGTGATAQDEGTFGEWLDELPSEVAATTARLLKHYMRSSAWVEITPGSPSQPPRAGRDRDCGPHSSPNCPSDMSEPSDNSD